ncbi:MFS transporter [Cryobacterium algoricola]|uniref:MFS transporter n=1 Tax=Cryobacterium algoricola TaxID=1259183 RepID=A0ABY2IE06_9MICO|nr:MFS transporter [Cryobacterium algoricola]TFB86862.1 MFS transporter [Cryobacterium algoricola]
MTNEEVTQPSQSDAGRKTEGRRTILAVGWASFFGGVSQDIVIPILPLYLTQVLGLDKAFIGVAEGLVTAASSVFKIIAGRLSDRLPFQRPLVAAGYSLSMVGRLGLVFASGTLAVFALRFTDGIGKGVKDPPKDVLVANAAAATTRGRSFGITRMLDTFGSALGPLVLSGLLFVFVQNHVAPEDYYRWLLVLSALVLVITLAIVQLGIREKRRTVSRGDAAAREPLARSFYLFTTLAGLFAIANSSDAFLILRAQNLGLGVIVIPLAYAVLNIIYGALALPAGILSDRVGRIPLITAGWTLYAVCYLGFALADSAWQVWPLFALYGIFYAVTEGVSKALIADTVGREVRGRAYGVYNMVIGLAALPASLVAGLLWDGISSRAPFFFSAALALMAVVLMIAFRHQVTPRAQRSSIAG